MPSNYSTSVSVDTIGRQILQFDVEEIDSLMLTPDSDILVGFTDLSQAVFPVQAGSSYNMSHLDFRNQTLLRNVFTAPKIITVFAKGKIGNANIAIAFLGGNR
jgi:hypothetical protein